MPYTLYGFHFISVQIRGTFTILYSQIIGDQYPEIWKWKKINYVAFVCHWLAMSHSAYNPIIYCCFNSKFRQVRGPLLAVYCTCCNERGKTTLNAHGKI